jgi:dihydroorotate dehydrogenase
LSALQSLGARALGLIDPETAHGLALHALRMGLGGQARARPDPILATRLAGMALDNPIGLAAGFDKDAVAPAALLRAGFGFVAPRRRSLRTAIPGHACFGCARTAR